MIKYLWLNFSSFSEYGQTSTSWRLHTSSGCGDASSAECRKTKIVQVQNWLLIKIEIYLWLLAEGSQLFFTRIDALPYLIMCNIEYHVVSTDTAINRFICSLEWTVVMRVEVKMPVERVIAFMLSHSKVFVFEDWCAVKQLEVMALLYLQRL